MKNQDLPSKVRSFKFNRKQIEVPKVRPRAGLRDGLELYGSEAAAVAQITRQLATQRDSMEAEAVAACEKALSTLERGHDLTFSPGEATDPPLISGRPDRWKASGGSAEILAEALGRTTDLIRRYPREICTHLNAEEVEALTLRGFILIIN